MLNYSLTNAGINFTVVYLKLELFRCNHFNDFVSIC